MKEYGYTEEVPEKNKDKIAENVDQDYNRRACAAHNRYRRYHGAPALGIDWELANGAQKWAIEMNTRQKMEHSQGDERDGENGENLAVTTDVVEM